MTQSKRFIREENYKQFQEAFQTLNDAQKRAVMQTEGPVMVVAGPGTGKTQLLAARVGYILDQVADINPRNILCLTYTDAGAIAMRKRLLHFIGPEAYNVNIFTFHSFCNKIIKENISEFGGFRNLQALSDLEHVEVLHEIIDEFPDEHPLKRFKGNIYYERYGMKNLFETMKKENWTAEIIQKAYDDHAAKIADDEVYQYKRKYTDKKTGTVYQAGDTNPNAIAKELKKYEPTLNAMDELKKYDIKLEEKERFDYADMILWVLKEWKRNENLLMDYQEQYQYVLVDEYQDTNGTQNEIVDLLISYWGEQANVFVVGDDDQSIFRFQGANMGNIVRFKEKYGPELIILENNYRSSQTILDRSKALIEENAERLVHSYPEYTKNLIESRGGKHMSPKPILKAYFNDAHELKDIADQIIQLSDQGVDLSEIAVIYKKHRNAENLVKYLEHKNIPLNLKKKINVLQEVEVIKLISILKYIHSEITQIHSGEDLLFKILHYKSFDLNSYDLGKLAIYCSRKTEEKEDDFKWRTVLQNEKDLKQAGVKDIPNVLRVGALIENWINDIHNFTMQTLFEKILTEANIFTEVMNSGESAWRFQLINTFFDLIKKETAKDAALNLGGFIKIIDQMEEAEVSLPLVKIIHSKDGVNFITAHSSKGLEFEYVFIINADEKNWVEANYKNNRFKFPPTLVPASELSDIEDDRRLFYVAMTRCKNHLHISYSKTAEDKALEPCRFIHELMGGSDLEIQDVSLPENDVIEFNQTIMGFKKGEPKLLDHDAIGKVLTNNYSMSVTHLNKYLRCPLSFYFENILRVPMARSKSMGFGNAVHHSLEQFFNAIEQDPERKIGNKESLIDFFEKGLYKYRSHFTEKEYKNFKTYGGKIMSSYFDHYHLRWSLVREFKQEHTVKLSEYKGIPINGKIDSIAFYDDKMEVIDYKTGKYTYAAKKLKAPQESDKIEEQNGGDYWRQIVFYKMLLQNDPKINKPMTSGTMDFIEPANDKHIRKTIEVDENDIATVEKQLGESYKKIQNHEFEQFCEDENCQWCNFVRNNYSFSNTGSAYADEVDLADGFTDIAEPIE